MIGQHIPPEREAWERDQIETMRRRMELMHRARVAIRAGLITIGIVAAIVAAALAKHFLS